MEWVKLIMGLLKEVLPTLATFMVGRKSKELEDVKDENDKLKKYQEIDDSSESSADDAYTARLWE